MMVVLAKWQSRGEVYSVDLSHSIINGRYGYSGCAGDGSFKAKSDRAAVAIMQARIDLGEFLPDVATLPMTQVI